MMKRFGMKTVFAAILGIPLAFAQTAPESSKDAPTKAPESSSNPTSAELPAVPVTNGSGSGRTVYGEVEYLLWWMKGMELPALATTSPNGTAQDQAGVLGAPGTANLFGGNSVNTSPRSGGRFVAGAWLDNAQNMGLEAEFLFLETKATRFSASSDGSAGSQILARPYTNANDNVASSIRVAFPGDVSGNLAAQATTTGLVGGGVIFRQNLEHFQRDNFRLDGLVGYRAMTFSEGVGIYNNMTNIDPNNPNFVPLGTRIDSMDSIKTSNTFNGFEAGLAGKFFNGPISLLLDGRIALGMNHVTGEISGATNVNVPLNGSISYPGGLYALSSNIGNYGHQTVSIIPQFNAKAGYQLNSMTKLTFGYNLLVWSAVTRAGLDIDQVVNPNLMPGSSTSGGTARPSFGFNSSTFWAQGLSLGAEFNY